MFRFDILRQQSAPELGVHGQPEVGLVAWLPKQGVSAGYLQSWAGFEASVDGVPPQAANASSAMPAVSMPGVAESTQDTRHPELQDDDQIAPPPTDPMSSFDDRNAIVCYTGYYNYCDYLRRWCATNDFVLEPHEKSQLH